MSQEANAVRNRDGSPSQIQLMSAMSRNLTIQGFPYANARQFNALVAAANLVVDAYAIPHRPSVPGSGLAAWFASDDTGDSSIAMANHLGPLAGEDRSVHGRPRRFTSAHPLDPDDLGRCVRLLDAAPTLRPHLPRMAELSPAWAALVAAWEELEALYREELPSGNAPKCYGRMQAILEGLDV